MATLPEGAEVLFTEGLWVPLVNLEGVYILPGIPRLFQQAGREGGRSGGSCRVQWQQRKGRGG